MNSHKITQKFFTSCFVAGVYHVLFAVSLLASNSSQRVNSLYFKGHHLWVGTENGLIRWNTTSLNYDIYGKMDGLSHDDIKTIISDSKGIIWVGTRDGGVCYFDESIEWKCIQETEDFFSNHITSSVNDNKGNIWFGSHRDGISRYDGTNWTNYTEKDGLLSNSIRTFCHRRNGDLWIATDKGVNIYSNAKWSHITLEDGLPSHDIKAIVENSRGELWIAAGEEMGSGGGVARLNNDGSWKLYQKDDGLGDNDVHCLTFDDDGQLWCGTYGGVSSFAKGAWKTYFHVNERLKEEWVFAINVNSPSNIWLGTSLGLFKFDGKNKLTLFNAE